MPANLTPDYHRAEERLRAARTVADKIAALEEMLRVIPKHKGTDALQGDLRARIAKLRRQPERAGARSATSHLIPREGAAQIVLVGMPNTGKSSLVGRLTHAQPRVGDFPFTTRDATPGMMPFEDIAFQLIDLPPLSDQHVEPWVFDLIRRADLAWLVVDASDPLGEIDQASALLEARNIALLAPGEAAPTGGPAGRTYVRALLVMTGLDRPGTAGDAEALAELLGGRWRPVAVSALSGAGSAALGRRTFETLGIMRVYTKQPGKPADRRAPFTLPPGSTVGDLAAHIHKEIAAQMKFARIWGPSVFDGQTVQRDHVLAEGDVVEIHV